MQKYILYELATIDGTLGISKLSFKSIKQREKVNVEKKTE